MGERIPLNMEWIMTTSVWYWQRGVQLDNSVDD